MASSSQINITDFSDNILDKTIHFKVIKLDQSFFVWVGSEPILSNMAVAMPAEYNPTPISSVLFGNSSETTSPNLAQKLAKRFTSQVFVSCSVPYDQQLTLLIEKRLAQELGSKDEKERNFITLSDSDDLYESSHKDGSDSSSEFSLPHVEKPKQSPAPYAVFPSHQASTITSFIMLRFSVQCLHCLLWKLTSIYLFKTIRHFGRKSNKWWRYVFHFLVQAGFF